MQTVFHIIIRLVVVFVSSALFCVVVSVFPIHASTGTTGSDDGYCRFEKTLVEELQKREYARHISMKYPPWIDHIADKLYNVYIDITDKYLRKFHGIQMSRGASRVSVGFIVGALVVAAVAVIVLFACSIFRERYFRGIDVDNNKMNNPFCEHVRNYDETIAKADNYALDGRYRDALRLLYISFLHAVEAAGMLSFPGSKTNREYLAELSRKLELPEEIVELTNFYELVWYGLRNCTKQQYDECKMLYKVSIRVLER